MTFVLHNHFSSLGEHFFKPVKPDGLTNSFWVVHNDSLAKQFAIDLKGSDANRYLQAFSGNAILENSKPLAMVYAGHQFGGYTSQLGDGRGLLLGEAKYNDQLWDFHLKGAGPTPFSRGADGRSVLRSSIREYLCSEALFHLGVPTTRALCITGSDLPVWRESQETAAMLVRIAQSHIRFGHFEYFFYTEQTQALKNLLDYCIKRYYPDLDSLPDTEKYAAFFRQTVVKTAKLIAHWQSIGFAHGVMNTDNMSILGDTFDFGPYGFMEAFDQQFICNHSDYHGRYAFNQQPSIGLWNLNALAHALSTFIEREELSSILSTYETTLVEYYAEFMRKKLGWQTKQDNDQEILGELLSLMEKVSADYTNTFRQLSNIEDAPETLNDIFNESNKFNQWRIKYLQRCKQETLSAQTRKVLMDKCNPKYILRNYLAHQAIEQAKNNDFSELEKLAKILETPFDEQPENEDYASSRPEWAKSLVVSCSS